MHRLSAPVKHGKARGPGLPRDPFEVEDYDGELTPAEIEAARNPPPAPLIKPATPAELALRELVAERLNPNSANYVRINWAANPG